MRTYEMQFPGFDARSNRGVIRWELFLHRDVRDVLITPREDTLLVVFRGEPDLRGWARTLAEAGLPVPRIDGKPPDRIVQPPGGPAA
jgi:hypothetical protein